MDIRHFIISLTGCTMILGASSCVKTDFTLGNNMVPDSDKFNTAIISFPIEEIQMRRIDKLSGYSNIRVSIGSIVDEVNGVEVISRRGSAFPLIPLCDTVLNKGTNITFESFSLHLCKDTLSVIDESQLFIQQNLRVYDLRHIYTEEEKDSVFTAKFKYSDEITNSMFEGEDVITEGIPVYGGESSLTIPFSEEFAMTYLGEGGKESVKNASEYTKAHPGIYICTDDPVGKGGRFSFFNVTLEFNQNAQSISNCFAELRYKADFGTRTQVDTSIIFTMGGNTLNLNATCSAFNVCEMEYEGGESPEDFAEEAIVIEDGTGLKPMIRAEYLRNTILEHLQEAFPGLTTEEISKKIVLNRATISMPFSMPDNHKDWRFFPQILSPTVRIPASEDENHVVYGGLTDSSVEDENQGNIDRNILSYHPDITHHMQEIISTSASDTKTLENSNIWFMILAEEVMTTNTTTSMDDYYNQLAYMNYYGGMMGGYGGYGYGGYGGYNDYNYYNYMMMQQMMSNAGTSTSTSTLTILDKDRYYKCVLNGPQASGERPMFKMVYSYARE